MNADEQEPDKSPDGKMAYSPNDPVAGLGNSPILRRPIILGDLTLSNPTTQTTIGGNGSASAMPTPLGYVLVQVGNSTVAIAYFNPS